MVEIELFATSGAGMAYFWVDLRRSVLWLNVCCRNESDKFFWGRGNAELKLVLAYCGGDLYIRCWNGVFLGGGKGWYALCLLWE